MRRGGNGKARLVPGGRFGYNTGGKKRNRGGGAMIPDLGKRLSEYVAQFNAQYGNTLTVKESSKFHDRFLIIDHTTLYHIGASLKDLGKKCFAFEIMEDASRLIPLILSNC